MVVVAFGGWNDAGEAATDVMELLARQSDAEQAFTLDPDDYYDYTQVRPMLIRDGVGNRHLEWLTTEVMVGSLPKRDVVLVVGPEPQRRWREFCSRLVSAFKSIKPERIVFLGAMLSDAPHRRPIQVAQDSSDYEGPTGIVGVLAQTCLEAGLPTTSLWASVPHYVADPPSPKVALALLSRLERVLDCELDPGELVSDAATWEQRVDELITDPEIAIYISELEERYDDEVTDGDQIAAEIERYLRRHNE